jgi:ribulose-5-phosphate 4-epimerase/fuculose-1-phosphate aldolase
VASKEEASKEAEVLSVKNNVSEAEWGARVDLAACYRMVAHNGWDDTIFTHISVRVPESEDHFLINPFGMYFDEITASSLVKVDLKGNIIMPSPYFVNPAGFVIHGAIHGAREDAHCVLHTHTVAGMAVAAQKHGLLPLSQTAMSVYSDVAYHEYEGIVLDEEERDRLIPNVGTKNNVILRNHGLLTMGTNVGEAYLRMFFLQKACETQVAAMAQGSELIMPSEEVAHRVSAQTVGGFTGLNQLNWDAVLRKADRVSPGYSE